MAIRTRGDALQIDVTETGPTGDKLRHREAFHGDMKSAQTREAEIVVALRKGEDPSSKRPMGTAGITLKDALDATWAKYWQGKGCERTVQSSMRICCEFFGATKRISEITTEDADKFIAWMKAKGNQPATIRQKVACMTKMLNHYHKRGTLKAKPHFETDPIGDNLRDRVIDREEEATLLDLFATRWDHITFRRADGHTGADWQALWVLLVDTGARPSEARQFDLKNLRGSLLTIKGTALDDDGNRVRASKTGKDRTLPLTKRALAAFEHLTATYGHRPLTWATPDAIRHAWDWARGAMDLAADEGFIPYALRHTCATRLYEKTRDIVLVKDWLGHTDIKMTMRYAKLMPGALEAARDLLDGDQPSPPAARLAA